MTQRSYSLDEIDKMRRAIERWDCPSRVVAVDRDEAGKVVGTQLYGLSDSKVEDLLRTYMAAGIEPEKLCDGLETAYDKHIGRP